MSDLGYFVHYVDMSAWLTRAQKSIVVKNKVRKELWQELVDIIHWDPLPHESRGDYLRIPQASFVAMQTFCLTDGKGADTVSSDQMLSFCTTLDQLRSRLPSSRLLRYLEPTLVVANSTVPVTTAPVLPVVQDSKEDEDEDD